MTTFTRDPSLTRAVEAALSEPPFASLIEAGGALLVAAGHPVQILYANQPALALFGAQAEAMARRLFTAPDPGARRVSELSRSLVPGAAARLEKLRLYSGLRAQMLTVVCRRTLGPQPLFILAVPAAPHLKQTQPDLTSMVMQPEPAPQEIMPQPIAPVVAAPILVEVHKPLVPAAMPPKISAHRSAGEVAADVAMRLKGSENVRFLWQTDAAHRFVKITGELCDFVGCMTNRLIGRSFIDVADELKLDPDYALRDALMRGETWSGLEIIWPVENADAAFPVTLGALPAHDRERRFEGYRGFGVIHVTRLQELAAQVEVAPVAEEDIAPVADGSQPHGNVVSLRPFQVIARRDDVLAEEPVTDVPVPPNADEEMVNLSPSERHSFREIARALGAHVRDDKPAPLAPASVRDLIEVASRAAGEPTVAPTIVGSAPQVDLPADVQSVLNRLPIGLLVSRDAHALYVNRTLLDLLGYADADQFFREDGMARMFRDRLRDTLSDETGALQIFARDGEPLALEARIQKVEWDHAPASLMTFRRTDRAGVADRIRELEGELRLAESGMRELHAILDTATDGVAVLDGEGHILALNRAGEALFGYEQSDVAGQSFTMLLAKESMADAQDYFAGLKGSGVAALMNDGRDLFGRARQGGSIPIFMALGRIGGNGAQKFCAVMRDMTAWKKAEQELKEARRLAEQASALKSDFLAKVSHEIRTPLNAILGFAEVIMEERFGPIANERYKEYMTDIHTSGAHVMSLVNDLLDLSKIEAGKLELDFNAVDANRIVAECVSLIQPQASRERVIVRQSLAPRLPNIVADERALRQIVLNLLSNAVKFNEEGGQVIVSTALTDAGHAVIRIKDTGIGMSESEIETALEPFRQIATARATRGTGLGLPLTKALIEANRASFSIKSKKAEGTLVEVAFPPTRVLAE